MKFLFRINQLLIFLVLSLSLIVMADSTVLFGEKKSTFRLFSRTSDIEDLVHIPKSGHYQTTDCLFVYNPDVKLKLSLNGGDSFQDFGSNKILNSIRNENISHLPMSLHWKSPGFNLPELKSIVIDTKSPENFGETESRVLTYYQDWGSDLPVVSLSIKNSNLYDEAIGIMNYGETSWTDSGFYKSWWYRAANFSERGIEWERPVNFQYFENGVLNFEQDLGMRISGNATRYFPQKSFRLYARKMYGNELAKHKFWGNEACDEMTSFLLRNGGNDNSQTMLTDFFIQELASATNVTVLKGKPVSVFINGNYWGIYFLQERIDPTTLAFGKDCKEKEITIMDAPNGELKEGDEDEANAFFEMVDDLEKNKVSLKKYKIIDEQMNVSSFIDYVVLETFIGNNDWPNNNCTWYKNDGGKWEWIIYDSDVSMAYAGSQNVNKNHLEKFLNGSTITSRLFSALMKYPEFKTSFLERAKELLSSVLAENSTTKMYNQIRKMFAGEVEWQIKRWRSIESMETWIQNCEANEKFLQNRIEIYNQHIEALE